MHFAHNFSFCFVILSFAAAASVLQSASVRDNADDIVWTGGKTPNGNYQLRWSYSQENEDIIFQIQAKATGYVGLGITETGSMRDADIFFGYVKDGHAHILDCHGPSGGNGPPSIDENNNLELISGNVANGQMTITFKRKLRTCDSNEGDDIDLDSSTTRMIFSYSNKIPELDGSVTDLPYALVHERSDRGNMRAYLTSETPPNPELPQDSISIEMRNKDIEIPNIDTTYWCQMFKIDKQKDLGGQEHHLIMSNVLIGGHEEVNSPYAHHLLLYRCNRFPEGWQESDERENGGDCYDDKSALVPLCIQDELIAAWAVGGEPFYFPRDVGLPIGEREVEYFIMDFHYDNPTLDSGVIDNSGVNLVMTPTKRLHDAGVIFAGLGSFYHLLIPPGDPNFVVQGNCHMNCTEAALPESGVKVFAGFLHTHLLGHSVTVKHIRDGVELPYLFQDTKYDFNYQTTITPQEEIDLKQGDAIQVQCGYDSSDLNRVTYGGLSTKEEMCLTFLFYYPRGTLPQCLNNSPPPQLVGPAIGIQTFYHNPQEWWFTDGQRQGPIVEVDGVNYTWANYLNDYQWTHQTRKAVEQVGFTTDLRYFCGYMHNDAGGYYPQIEVTSEYTPPGPEPCPTSGVTTSPTTSNTTLTEPDNAAAQTYTNNGLLLLWSASVILARKFLL